MQRIADAVIDAPPVTLALPHALAERGTHVARTAELDTIDAALADVTATGGVRAVFLGGEPGMGKTWLAAACARRAHRSGATVLFGRSDDDLGLPYQAFMEALRPLVAAVEPTRLEGAGELVRLLPEVAARVGDAGPLQADPEAERWALFEAVAELLAIASVGAPVVLVLDDAQWAAKPTLLLVRHLLRSTRPLRLLVLATYRHTELDRSHALGEALVELRREPNVERLVLTGLDESGVAAMVQARGGDRSLAAELRDTTGGNPFFVDEVLRHLDESGGTNELPESIRDVVSRRLARLSTPTQRALTIGAVLGGSFAFRLLEAVAAVQAPDLDLLDALDEAVASGLVVESGEEISFSHALVRQTLLDELSTSRRMRLHRRIGEALEAVDADGSLVDVLAHHFAESALDGQAAKAAQYALAAGLRAIRSAAHEHAATVLHRGLDALEVAGVEDRALRADLSVLAASAMAATDGWGYDLVVTLLQRALDDGLATGVPERIIAAIEVRVDHQRVSVGDAEMDVALDDLLAQLDVLDAETRARVLAADAFRLADRGGPGSVAAADLAIDAAIGTSPKALRRALRAKMATLYAAPRPSDILAITDELAGSGASPGEVHHWVTTIAARAGAHLQRLDLAAFEHEAARMDELHERTRAAQARFYTVAFRATCAAIAGRWDDLAAASSGVLEFAEDTDAFNIWAALEYRRHWDLGRLGDFLPAVEAAAMGSPGVPALRAARALARAEVGDEELARTELHEMVAALPTMPRDRVWQATMQVLAFLAGRLRDVDAAGPLYGAIAPYAGLLLAPGAGTFPAGLADEVLASLAAVLGRHDVAADHAARALAMAERAGSPPLRARALLAGGTTQLLAGDGTAQTTLRAAVATAEGCGMAGVSADASALLTGR